MGIRECDGKKGTGNSKERKHRLCDVWVKSAYKTCIEYTPYRPTRQSKSMEGHGTVIHPMQLSEWIESESSTLSLLQKPNDCLHVAVI